MQQYDMSDYMANDTPTQALSGAGGFLKALKQDDTHIVVIKSPSGYPYEQYELGPDGYIYLRQETGCALDDSCDGVNDWQRDNFRFWPSYRWMPRLVHDGMIFDIPETNEYYQFFDRNGLLQRKKVSCLACKGVINICVPPSAECALVGSPLLVARSEFWKTPGVIDPNNREVYYYDKWRGLMLWEDWNGGVVTAHSVFNQDILSDAQPVGPSVPTDLSGFTPCGS